MKNTFIFITLVTLTIIVARCTGSSGTDSANKASVVNDLPFLNVMKTSGEPISLREAPSKSILIFFNPDCDHCQREAQQISAQKSLFKNYSVYFISIDPMDKIQQFALDYKLTDRNFFFAQADSYEVYKTVGPLPTVPAIFIYANRQFVKKLEGEVKLEEVMKYL